MQVIVNLTIYSIELRNRLSQMISKESKLGDKRDEIKQDIVKLKDKIEKVSKIRRDMQDI